MVLRMVGLYTIEMRMLLSHSYCMVSYNCMMLLRLHIHSLLWKMETDVLEFDTSPK
jgi:hypothetical protein